MRVRFSVSCFVSPKARIGVCGSLKELGSWKKAVPLTPIGSITDEVHPSFWTCLLDVPDNEPFEYKFVRWESDDSDILVCDHQSENAFGLPLIPCSFANCGIPKGAAIWEGNGTSDNRRFVYNTGAATSSRKPITDETDTNEVHCYNEENYLIDQADEQCNGDCSLDGGSSRHSNYPNLLFQSHVYTLPVALFREPHSSLSEYSHTTRYYRRLKEKNAIHFDKVAEKIFVGTCPRTRGQIEDLKRYHGISDVMNFQTGEDITENFPDSLGVPMREKRTPQRVLQLYKDLNISYVWLPTTDMCSDGRAHVGPQAALLLAGLLQRDDCTGIYIHCNAGVGRSVACVAAFLVYCQGVSVRRANLLLCARRPVAFFDERAVRIGWHDFHSKFRDAANRMVLQRCPIKSLPGRAEQSEVMPTAREILIEKQNELKIHQAAFLTG